MIIDNLYAPEKNEDELTEGEKLVNRIMARNKSEEDYYKLHDEVDNFLSNPNVSDEDKAEVEEYTECMAIAISGIEYAKSKK